MAPLVRHHKVPQKGGDERASALPHVQLHRLRTLTRPSLKDPRLAQTGQHIEGSVVAVKEVVDRLDASVIGRVVAVALVVAGRGEVERAQAVAEVASRLQRRPRIEAVTLPHARILLNGEKLKRRPRYGCYESAGRPCDAPLNFESLFKPSLRSITVWCGTFH